MTATEHILLESDLREVPDLEAARKLHARVELHSRVRRRILQLAIFDYYYLSVYSQSPGRELEYSIDLRFVQTPHLSRHIAWRWLGASLGLFVLIVALAAVKHAAAPSWWRQHWLTVCSAFAAGWAAATVVCIYRTTESVRLFSTFGAARLLDFSGGLGTFRAMRPFLGKLAAHIRLASSARRSTKAEHLRDEMREHVRLREAEVLSASDYEASKARILRQHAPAGRRRAVAERP
jgi:hypothetical protein